MYPKIFAGGEARALSLHFRQSSIGDPTVCSGVIPSLIERKDLPKEGVDLSGHVQRILNQGQHNLCWGFGWVGAVETALALAGRKAIRLSPGNLCGQVNGGVDQGAGVDEPPPVLMKSGVAPDNLVPDLDYRPSQWPAGWQAQAAKHKLLKIWDLGHDEVIAGLATAITRRWPCPLGTSAFGGGHCVYATTYWFESTGLLRFAGPNSWSTNWTNWAGHPGFWTYNERELTNLRYFGAFGVEAAAVDPDDVPPTASVAS